MPRLKQLQDDFSAYLLSSHDNIVANVAKQGTLDANFRLGIYKNAYQIRLTECIDNDHPVLGLYLGDDLFTQMANAYITKHPSHYPSLRYFCDRLPAFLSTNEPFKSTPVLAEIAAFERLMLSAFDAAESQQRASAKTLQAIKPERWPSIRLKFHPSVFDFQANWNSVQIWQAIKNQKTPASAIKDQNHWLIWRSTERLTEFISLTGEANLIYQQFKQNQPFSEICELLLDFVDQAEIGQVMVQQLMDWLHRGVIEAFDTD